MTPYSETPVCPSCGHEEEHREWVDADECWFVWCGNCTYAWLMAGGNEEEKGEGQVAL
jgi:hypothetical protein